MRLAGRDSGGDEIAEAGSKSVGALDLIAYLFFGHFVSDHAFGFELADVGPAAIEVRASADALTVAGLATDGRSKVAVSAIVFIPVASR